MSDDSLLALKGCAHRQSLPVGRLEILQPSEPCEVSLCKSFFLDWSASLEMNHLIFCLQGGGLTASILEAKRVEGTAGPYNPKCALSFNPSHQCVMCHLSVMPTVQMSPDSTFPPRAGQGWLAG